MPGPPVVDSSTTNLDATAASSFPRDNNQGAGKKPGDDREKDPGFLPVHYAECYPGYHDTYAATVVDSDDEDFTKMDTRGKGLSRLVCDVVCAF